MTALHENKSILCTDNINSSANNIQQNFKMANGIRRVDGTLEGKFGNIFMDM